MSGYLTHLVQSVLNPQPDIRPRLGSPFEPIRPEFNREPYPVERMETGVKEEQAEASPMTVRLDTVLQFAGVSEVQAQRPTTHPATIGEPAPVPETPDGSGGSISPQGVIAGRRKQVVAEDPGADTEISAPSVPPPDVRSASETANHAPVAERGTPPCTIANAPIPTPPSSHAPARTASLGPVRRHPDDPMADGAVIVTPPLVRQSDTLGRLATPGSDLLRDRDALEPAILELPVLKPAVVAPSVREPRSRPAMTLAALGVTETASRAPTVQVTIGRIEVRATPAPEKPARTISKPKVMGLAEYLEHRSGERR